MSNGAIPASTPPTRDSLSQALDRLNVDARCTHNLPPPKREGDSYAGSAKPKRKSTYYGSSAYGYQSSYNNGQPEVSNKVIAWIVVATIGIPTAFMAWGMWSMSHPHTYTYDYSQTYQPRPQVDQPAWSRQQNWIPGLRAGTQESSTSAPWNK